jgi:hypothetical protein
MRKEAQGVVGRPARPWYTCGPVDLCLPAIVRFSVPSCLSSRSQRPQTASRAMDLPSPRSVLHRTTTAAAMKGKTSTTARSLSIARSALARMRATAEGTRRSTAQVTTRPSTAAPGTRRSTPDATTPRPRVAPEMRPSTGTAARAATRWPSTPRQATPPRLSRARQASSRAAAHACRTIPTTAVPAGTIARTSPM